MQITVWRIDIFSFWSEQKKIIDLIQKNLTVPQWAPREVCTERSALLVEKQEFAAMRNERSELLAENKSLRKKLAVLLFSCGASTGAAALLGASAARAKDRKSPPGKIHR
jgi:hypothetical protein